ncbi:PrsW family intramembrane metalloprotease [Candidatus Kaiserbacteria bacterium]|nr:PrsW family intramembrane metalloprotease [Candidatus Kaiserbacteria bacterium]
MSFSLETLGYAFLGGLLPSLIWLYFLLKEDARCPEPRRLVALAFVAGMAAVPVVLPLEQWISGAHLANTSVLIGWATIEETMKYIAAALFILWQRSVDESPDYVIYMLTVALGFAAAENMLFLLAPLSTGHLVAGLVTDNLRFVGSTLLHVLASAAIGFSLAFSLRLGPATRAFVAAGGLILAIVLHTAFNALIIRSSGATTLTAFFLIWSVAVIFFAVFEILKYIQYRNVPANVC